MICKPCCDRDHDRCPGGTHCTCQHQPPRTGEKWETIPPTDRNTFVSVWSLDDDSIPSGRVETK